MLPKRFGISSEELARKKKIEKEKEIAPRERASLSSILAAHLPQPFFFYGQGLSRRMKVPVISLHMSCPSGILAVI
jgi:hypothetical protein